MDVTETLKVRIAAEKDLVSFRLYGNLGATLRDPEVKNAVVENVRKDLEMGIKCFQILLERFNEEWEVLCQ